MKDKEIIVIGGGQSGIQIAIGAAKLGLQVLLIEKQDLLHEQCGLAQKVRHKNFLDCAHMCNKVLSSPYQIVSPQSQVGTSRILSLAQDSWHKYPKKGIADTIIDLGIDVWFGEAKFISPRVIAVGGRIITSSRIILAVGKENTIPNIAGLSSINYYSPENFLQKESIPEKVALIGCNAVGLELAQSLAMLGVEVIVVVLPTLKGWDLEVLEKLQGFLEKQYVKFYFVKSIKEVYEQNSRKILLCADEYEDSFILDAHDIVFATEHKLSSMVNLMPSGIILGAKGIWVNEYLRTSQKNIYAVGAAVNIYNPSFNVEEQVSVALSNIILGYKVRKCQQMYNSYIVKTQPGYARVGLVESKGVKKMHAHMASFSKPWFAGEHPLDVDLYAIKDHIVGFKIYSFDIEQVVSSFMHTLDEDRNMWHFARAPYLPGTLSHALQRAILQQQPKGFFPHWFGTVARLNDKLSHFTAKIAEQSLLFYRAMSRMISGFRWTNK